MKPIRKIIIIQITRKTIDDRSERKKTITIFTINFIIIDQLSFSYFQRITRQIQ